MKQHNCKTVFFFFFLQSYLYIETTSGSLIPPISYFGFPSNRLCLWHRYWRVFVLWVMTCPEHAPHRAAERSSLTARLGPSSEGTPWPVSRHDYYFTSILLKGSLMHYVAVDNCYSNKQTNNLVSFSASSFIHYRLATVFYCQILMFLIGLLSSLQKRTLYIIV